MSLIAADAGPLIALSKIRRLSILTERFDQVIVPDAVVTELRLEQSRPGVEQLAFAVNKNPHIRTSTSHREGAVAGLDVGESAAILLAEEYSCPLLIDERRGRTAASRRGIRIIGTGRVLIAAKEHGLITSVKDELDALEDSGYRLSAPLYERLLELAGES